MRKVLGAVQMHYRSYIFAVILGVLVSRNDAMGCPDAFSSFKIEAVGNRNDQALFVVHHKGQATSEIVLFDSGTKEPMSVSKAFEHNDYYILGDGRTLTYRSNELGHELRLIIY
jgi:hypothetical protein